MSWSKSTKLNLSNEEIESILDAIDAKGIFGEWTRQSWGWSSEVDITKDNGTITFSGADFSLGSTLPERFMREARKRGYYKRIPNNFLHLIKTQGQVSGSF